MNENVKKKSSVFLYERTVLGMAELLDDRLPTQNIEAEQAVSINWAKLTFIQLYEHLTL